MMSGTTRRSVENNAWPHMKRIYILEASRHTVTDVSTVPDVYIQATTRENLYFPSSENSDLFTDHQCACGL